MFEKTNEDPEALLGEMEERWGNSSAVDPISPPSMDARPSSLWGGNADTGASAAGNDFSAGTPTTPPSDGVTFKFGSPTPPPSGESATASNPGFSSAPAAAVPQPPSAATIGTANPTSWSTPAATTPPPTTSMPTTSMPATSAPRPAMRAEEYNFSHIPPAEPPAKRSIGKWLGLITAGLALIVGGFFIGSQLRSDDASSTDTAAATAETVEAEVADRDPAITTESNTVAAQSSNETEAAAAAPVEAAPEVAPETADAPSAINANPVLSGSLEPIADVAEVLSPSVVQISDNVGGSGSGIVYDPDGHLVTNAHVVGDSSTVTIIFQDGLRVEGTVVGTDIETDVAVVKVEVGQDELAVARFADVANLRAGATAIAIGSPFGYDQTVTAGIVSSTRRPVASSENQQVNTTVPMIQTDAPINPGNSGGALADITGAVIGMNTLIRSTGTVNAPAGNIGIGFAIPSDIIQLVADGIIAGDPVKPSLLGVSTERSADFQLGEPGARVTSVTAGGPADLAGIVIGDRLTRFDGVPLSDFNDLAGVVRLSKAGVPIPVELFRDGEFIRLDVELVNR